MADERKGVYVPEKLLSDVSLGAQQKLVLAVMISAMDEFNVCRLSSQQIADRLSVTKVTEQTARRELCRAGRVKLIPKTRNNYKILGIWRKTNA